MSMKFAYDIERWGDDKSSRQLNYLRVASDRNRCLHTLKFKFAKSCSFAFFGRWKIYEKFSEKEKLTNQFWSGLCYKLAKDNECPKHEMKKLKNLNEKLYLYITSCILSKLGNQKHKTIPFYPYRVSSLDIKNKKCKVSQFTRISVKVL